MTCVVALTAGGCATQAVDTRCLETVAAVPVLQHIEAHTLIARMSSTPRSNAARLDRLRELFAEAGCGPRLTEQPVPGSRLPNLSCSLPGASESQIVVGAHFDKVDPGQGVADNWSGSVLLPTLYEDLSSAPRRHTFRFVAFSAEERGELGSRAFVRALDATRRDAIVAMVNLDTLGLNPTRFELREADPTLACLLTRTAELSGEEIAVRDNGRADSSDHEPFRDAGIPTIRLHSLSRASERVIHSRADRLEAIDQQAYYASYRLIVAYLAVLDQYSAVD